MKRPILLAVAVVALAAAAIAVVLHGESDPSREEAAQPAPFIDPSLSAIDQNATAFAYVNRNQPPETATALASRIPGELATAAAMATSGIFPPPTEISKATLALPTPSVRIFPTPPPDPYFDTAGVYYVNRDGTGLRRLSEPPPRQTGGVISYPSALSHDGSILAYVEQKYSDVYLAPAFASTIHFVHVSDASIVFSFEVPDGLVAHSLMWSRSNRYLTFQTGNGGSDHPLQRWLLTADGMKLERLPDSTQGATDWLPDDSGFLTLTWRPFVYHLPPETYIPPLADIFLVSLDGTVSEPLAPDAPIVGCQCGQYIIKPRLSPDGARIAYSSSGSLYVWTNGQGVKSVAGGDDGSAAFVRWNRDGSLVYSLQISRDEVLNYRYDPRTNESTLIGERFPVVSPDGTGILEMVTLGPCWSHYDSLTAVYRDGTQRDLAAGSFPGGWYLEMVEWLPDGGGLVFSIAYPAPGAPCG